MAGFSEWLFGSPDKLKKVPTGTPQQEALHNNILNQAMGMSQKGGGYDRAQDYYSNLLGPNQQQAYDQFSQPYMQQFQDQILPMIAERFAGGGALSSSGFGQAVGGAGAGLQGQLAKLFASLQSEAASNQTNQYNQLAQTGLNHQPFAYNQEEGSGGFLGPLMGGLTSALGGPLGNMLGQGISSGISSLFKKPQKGGISGFSPSVQADYREAINQSRNGGMF